MTMNHRDRRISELEGSMERMRRLGDALREEALGAELNPLLSALAPWLATSTSDRIRASVSEVDPKEIDGFFLTLRSIADDYAAAKPVDASAIRAQFGEGATA
jgi:hypothetical protein